MSRLMGAMLAGGMILATASSASAQIGVSIGSPYTGGGVYVGAPGFSYASPAYANGFAYNSGYGGYAAPGYVAPGYGYGYSAYRYPAYRAYRRPFGGYGYGWRRPFRYYR